MIYKLDSFITGIFLSLVHSGLTLSLIITQLTAITAFHKDIPDISVLLCLFTNWLRGFEWVSYCLSTYASRCPIMVCTYGVICVVVVSL